MSDRCPLCDKLSRLPELPADDLVWQFPHSVALLGPWQYHTGYCVLVARSHCTELHQLPAGMRSAFLDEMVTLAHAIEIDAVRCSGNVLHQLPAGMRSAFLDEMVTLAHAIEIAFQPRKMNCELLGNQVPH